jgi:hypothetical protein
MIQITKGNPTPEEIAALVAALVLANGTTQPHPPGSSGAQWRRAAPSPEVTSGAPSRRDRHWQAWCAGWSGSPACAPPPHRVQWALRRSAS